MMRVLVALLVSLVSASCAIVRTNVAVSHMLPAAGAAKTVAIVPYTENLAAEPDFQGNAGKLAAQLEAKGFDVVPQQGASAPDYLAFFLYRIDDGTPVNRIASAPYPPTGSIVSYGPRVTSGAPTQVVYRRILRLEILDRARFQPNMPASYLAARVYSGSVTSEGGCSTMAPVIEPMLDALFADFPGQSGRLTTIDVTADSTCGGKRFG